MNQSPSSEKRSTKTVTVPLNEVKPYWRNPRIIPEEAVEAVSKSIEEFGYVQPIVTDKRGVIIIGHTRYIALRRMDVEKVEVIQADLTDRQAKELRIIDNRSAEFSTWDYLKLMDEIERTESGSLSGLFPDLAVSDVSDKDVFSTTDEDGSTQDSELDFICPSCFHEWVQTVTRDQIFDGKVSQA